MKFVDVTNDVAFRKIFGNEHKTIIIISFLNAILKLEGDARIQEVTITNPYQLPRVAGEKASIIDVKVKDMKGRQFVVEMQVADVNGFDKRVQYYACRDYSLQINRGEEYPKLKPTYFVGILDFNFFDGKKFLSHHLLLDDETYEHKLKDIKFTFIELKKFHKHLADLEDMIDKWTFFIKNAENLDIIPNNVDDEGLREAYKDADKHSWTKDELVAYDDASIAEQDARGRITAAEGRGLEQGKIEGRVEGKIEGKIEGKLEEKTETIRECLEMKMSVSNIARIVRLSEGEVQQIIDNLS